MQQIILASGSPRRREILKLLGLDFEVAESYYDEEKIVTDDPVELVEELAIQKAFTVAERYPDAIIIGGDTTVFVDGEILAKANSKKQAKEMFGKLVGKTHQVVTGIAVVNSLTNESFVGHEEGIVTFRPASERELEDYAEKTSNWRGFAGAYALQGGAAPFALNQTGKLSAIIGMPVELTKELLEHAGVTVDADARAIEDSLHDEHAGIGIE
jgi:septum formation protein